MLIPTGHENLEGRRWPWITIAIIVLNFIAFGFTYPGMEDESARLSEIKLKTLLLAAYHEPVKLSEQQQQMVAAYKKSNPKMWDRMRDQERRPEGAWDVRMRNYELSEVNAELAELDTRLTEIQSSSVLEKYAFHPTQRTPVTYLTSSFLHGGWFHIIFNMWFLWLAGSVIEDAWGRLLYPVFYGMACFLSLAAHTRAHPDSIVGVIGSSGAVAALMGAFLVRNFKTKINFMLIWFITFVPRVFRFKAPAWAMLPLWFFIQIFWGLMEGEGGGVAYWSHTGGFLFGLVAALGMKYSGLEKKLDQAIEAEVSWSSDPRIVEAGELITRDPNAAIEKLQGVLAEQPENTDALALVSKAYLPLNRREEAQAALCALARIHVKKREFADALEAFEDYRQAGGENFPAAEWLAICRHLENLPNYERAAAEYEAYARAYPSERMSVYALVAAGRIHLKNLGNKPEAARLYRAADASAVPHLDWDDAIKKGLRDATAAEPLPAAS